MNYSRADSHYLHFIYAIIVDLMCDNKSHPVKLLKSTYEDNKKWLDIRQTKDSKWKGVLKDFQKKMTKFMIQRIEKSGKRTYKVVIHSNNK